MEELCKQLQGAGARISAARYEDRFDSYKNRGRTVTANLEKRRRLLLERQKSRRTNALEVARALVSGVDVLDDEDDEDDDNDLDRDISMDSEGEKVEKKISIKKSYKNHLMRSVWMEFPPPENLESDWIMVPVPKGSRTLVVCGDGRTKRYSRRGVYKGSFASLLEQKPGHTILDTIFDHASGTYYILDVMMLNGFSFYDCDANFRFKFLKSKLLEDFEGIDERKPGKNFYAFKPLTCYDTKKDAIRTLFSTSKNFCFSPSVLDGVLFYHKDTMYLPGPSPLVTWLNGFMFPEFLGIEVGDEILAERPIGYVGAKEEIAKFELNYSQKRERMKNPDEKMDTPDQNENC